MLVILGLLVGGVLSGQALIKSAELRQISEEYTRYVGAMNNFRDKYMSLPGDMPNATSFWATGTGNGDGDGLIENTLVATTNEVSMFWVDLAKAGMIEGSYTNISGVVMTPNVNSPASKSNATIAWQVLYMGTVANDGLSTPIGGVTTLIAGSNYAYPGVFNNTLVYSPSTPTGAISTSDAWNIDTKIDDGKPDSGTMQGAEFLGSATPGAGCGNQNPSNAALPASLYDLLNTSKTACLLIFKTGL